MKNLFNINKKLIKLFIFIIIFTNFDCNNLLINKSIQSLLIVTILSYVSDPREWIVSTFVLYF